MVEAQNRSDPPFLTESGGGPFVPDGYFGLRMECAGEQTVLSVFGLNARLLVLPKGCKTPVQPLLN